MSEKPQSATCFGSRVVDAGSYANIRSFGDLEASGDIRATRIRSFGDNIIRGRCSVKHLFTAGNLRVHEALQVENIRAFGNVVVDGQLTATQLRVMGDVSATGRVSCLHFQLCGGAHLDGGLSAEHFKLTGTCAIRGLVSAERIQIRSRGHCELDEIGGSSIVIRAGWDEDGCSRKAGFLNWRCKGTSQVRVIEGDTIYLENTTAETVRGQSITLGKGCRIGTIEYSKSLTQHPSAVVERTQRVDSSEHEQPNQHGGVA